MKREPKTKKISADNFAQQEFSGAGREFQNRIDAAKSQIRNQSQNVEELQGLLDQAVTLLESVSQHPALQDAADMKRRLENVESRLNQSGNVQ
jgi:hypothetical protein